MTWIIWAVVVIIDLTLAQTSPGFYVSAVQGFWKHWEKEKLLVTSNFSFSHSVFNPFGKLSAIFINFEIIICKLFQFGSLKFVVWERVKYYWKRCKTPFNQSNDPWWKHVCIAVLFICYLQIMLSIWLSPIYIFWQQV